nr:hypothetical protein [Candidatus Sigynarchaeota archaeon]
MIGIDTLYSAKDMWGDLVGGGQLLMGQIAMFIITIGCVIAVFIILIGAIVYFSHFAQWGSKALMGGIFLLVFMSCWYMAMFNASGPPDLSAWFRLPEG